MKPAGKQENSRLEAFSDAVFAFALTLLVVALEVPRSYADLEKLLGGFLPFACSFAVLVWVWFEHRRFFQRYRLEDGLAVALNGALLFVVLFYVYPLKFIFDSWFARFGVTGREITPMTLEQLARTSAIYGAGFAGLFAMFVLLHVHAWRQRAAMEMTVEEVFQVKADAGAHLINAGVGLLVILIALTIPRRWVPLAPMVFALLGPVQGLYGFLVGRRRDQRRAAAG